MGTWGIGTFDNDGAMDFLGRQIDNLTNIIEANITIEKIKYKNYLEDIGEVIVIPAIELVILLCLTYKTVLDVELDAVLRWQNAYLNIFDSTLENEDKKITNQRRIIIENNFKKLIELAN